MSLIFCVWMVLIYRKIYLVYYSIYLLSISVFMFMWNGVFIPNDFKLLGFFSGVSGISLLLFGQYFIISKKQKWSNVIAVTCALFGMLTLYGYLKEEVGLSGLVALCGFAMFVLLALFSPNRSRLTVKVLLFGTSFVTLAVMLMTANYYFKLNIPFVDHFLLVGVLLETGCFSFAMILKARLSEQAASQESKHAFAEMSKMVYPHQLQSIKKGASLESTMPTTTAHACVMSFDIVGSSKIKHVNAKIFFRNVFTRCNEIISEGYDGASLKANAYRIKEMGDGFLCSVGYPFQSMSSNSANDSIDLAKRFARVLSEEAKVLHSETPIACGIGIALDIITGFYPEAGTKEYDLYGQAIVLATRYEGMRKTLFEAEKGRSVLIIQEVVYQSLDPYHRGGFVAMDLKELGVVVRDDPAATRLYYQFLDQEASQSVDDRHLKAV